MNQNDEVLIKVTLDEEATQKRIVELRKQLTFLKSIAADLTKDFKAGAITGDQFEGAMERIFQQTQIVNKELQQQRKNLLDNDRQQKASTGSIEESRAKLSLLTAGYIQLSKAERENEDVGGQLEKRIKALSDELKESEEKLGDHRRSVGDYAKAVRVAGISVGEVQEAVKEGVQAFQVFTKGITLSRGALIALSAIPILLILAGLVALLTKSQAGMDKLAQYTKAVDLAITSLTQGFVKVGQAVVDFFSADTFSSFDKLKAKAQGVADALHGVSSGMADAARAGVEIEKTNQRLEASETALSVVRAKSRAEVERLKLLAEDTTKSNATRAGAAKKAFEVENGLMQQQIGLQKQRIANAEREYNLSGKTREDAKKLAEERIKLSEIEEDSLGKQTELNNNLNSIRQDGITKAKEARALAAQEAIAEAERALIMAKRKGEDTLKIEEQILIRTAAATALAVEKGNQQRKLIEAKLQADLLALRVQKAIEAQQQINRIEASGIESSLVLAQEFSKEALALTIERIRKQTQAEQLANEQALAGETNRIEREIKAGEIAIKGQKAIDDARNDFAKAEVERAAEIARLRLQTDEDINVKTLADIRKLASDRIDLEEKTQLDLLKLQKISEGERLVKQNAIMASALKSRRELQKQLRADIRADMQADADILLAESEKGSREELQAKRETLAVQMAAELDNEELTGKQKAAIRAKYVRLDKDLTADYAKEQISQIANAASQSVNILSTLIQAQSQKIANQLDKEQSFAVKSAGTNADLRAKIEEKFQKRKAELEKEAAEKRRKVASIENIINTAKAVTSAAPNVLLMALAAATGLAEQVVIDGQKFEKGTVLRGPSHAQGGIKLFSKAGHYFGEAEGDEIILAKGVFRSPALRAQASALNVAGGGKAFAHTTTFTPKPVFEYGGVTSINQDAGVLARTLAAQINQVQPVLVLDDVNSLNADRNRISRRVTIG